MDSRAGACLSKTAISPGCSPGSRPETVRCPKTAANRLRDRGRPESRCRRTGPQTPLPDLHRRRPTCTASPCCSGAPSQRHPHWRLDLNARTSGEGGAQLDIRIYEHGDLAKVHVHRCGTYCVGLFGYGRIKCSIAFRFSRFSFLEPKKAK